MHRSHHNRAIAWIHAAEDGICVDVANDATQEKCGYLFAEDLRQIWPGRFNGDMQRAATALRNAGFKSARATVAG